MAADIDKLLEIDTHNVGENRAFFSSFSPELPEVLETAVQLHRTFMRVFGQGATDDEDQREFSRCTDQLGVADDAELLALLDEPGEREEGDLEAIDRAREIYQRLWARWVRGLLVTSLGRNYMFAVTDLYRMRITPASGYWRLQAETVALLRLMRDKPKLAQEWTDVRTDEDGRRFHSRYQQDILRAIERYDLKEAYDHASGSAQHVRFASFAAGTRQQSFVRAGRRVTEINLLFQEVDQENTHWFLIHVLFLLRVQQRVFDALADAVPEVDDPILLEQRLPRFRRAIDSLWQLFAQAYPERVARWRQLGSETEGGL